MSNIDNFIKTAESAASRTRATTYVLIVSIVSWLAVYRTFSEPDWTYRRLRLYRNAYLSYQNILYADNIKNIEEFIMEVKNDNSPIGQLVLKNLKKETQQNLKKFKDSQQKSFIPLSLQDIKERIDRKEQIRQISPRLLTDLNLILDRRLTWPGQIQGKKNPLITIIDKDTLIHHYDYLTTDDVPVEVLQQFYNTGLKGNKPVYNAGIKENKSNPPEPLPSYIDNGLNDRVKGLETQYADNRIVRIPILGVSFEVNDLPFIIGIAFIVIIYLLGACYRFENKSIFFAIIEAKNLNDLDSLLLTQSYLRGVSHSITQTIYISGLIIFPLFFYLSTLKNLFLGNNAKIYQYVAKGFYGQIIIGCIIIGLLLLCTIIWSLYQAKMLHETVNQARERALFPLIPHKNSEVERWLSCFGGFCLSKFSRYVDSGQLYTNLSHARELWHQIQRDPEYINGSAKLKKEYIRLKKIYIIQLIRQKLSPVNIVELDFATFVTYRTFLKGKGYVSDPSIIQRFVRFLANCLHLNSEANESEEFSVPSSKDGQGEASSESRD